jgi:4-hydroxy-tetrahydrodipicolinate synthase
MLNRGSIVALVTPMHLDGGIDYQAFQELITWHIEQGTKGLVINGTTGESPTVTAEEKYKLLEIAAATNQGRISLIAGTGSNDTAASIVMTKQAAALGVDACLVVVPYYNRPSQAGLYAHFAAIAAASTVPIILYSVPKRTVADLELETIIQLAKLPNIIGIKDASGNLERLKSLKQRCSSLLYYSGDDASSCAFMQAGGHGVISVIANILPKQFAMMCQFALGSEPRKAAVINTRLEHLYALLGLEANPIPVKWALAYLKKIQTGIRLPLTVLATEYQMKLKEELDKW